MVDFERDRLDFILKKESEVRDLESKVKVVADCSNKHEDLQNGIIEIYNIISKLNLPPGSICSNTQIDTDKQIIEEIKHIIQK